MQTARQLRLVEQRRELREFFGSGPKVKPTRQTVEARGKELHFGYTYVFPIDPGRAPLSQHLERLAKLAKSAEAKAKEDSEYAAIEALRQTRERGWSGWKKSQTQPSSVRVQQGNIELQTHHTIMYDEPLTPVELRDIQQALHDWLS